MYYSDQLELGDISGLQDGYGSKPAAPSFVPKRTVWTNPATLARDEFYKAAAAGIKVTAVFCVRYGEYHDEPALRYDGKVYHIERAYKKRDEWVLNCSDLAIAGG